MTKRETEIRNKGINEVKTNLDYMRVSKDIEVLKNNYNKILGQIELLFMLYLINKEEYEIMNNETDKIYDNETIKHMKDRG